jgi:hypothetical protein
MSPDLAALPRDTVFYIAGPMSGYPEYNFPAFIEAANWLNEQGFYNIENPVVNGTADGAKPGEKTWVFYMKRGIEQLVRAQAIMLLPGWEDSKGATTEARLAEVLEYWMFSYELERK